MEKFREIFFTILVAILVAVPALAFEPLPDRTGIAVKAETRYDAYGDARLNRNGIAVNYQDLARGFSATGSTGYGLLKSTSVRSESQYFAISGAYRIFRIEGIEAGITADISSLAPFKTAVVEGLTGIILPLGLLEGKVSLIGQVKPADGLVLYGGPAFLLATGRSVNDHGFGYLAGAKYKVTDKVTVGASVTGADHVHSSATVAYNF